MCKRLRDFLIKCCAENFVYFWFQNKNSKRQKEMKMEEENLSHFRDNLASQLNQLWIEESFCDVNIVCQDGELQSYEWLLSCFSNFFKNILLDSRENYMTEEELTIICPDYQLNGN